MHLFRYIPLFILGGVLFYLSIKNVEEEVMFRYWGEEGFVNLKLAFLLPAAVLFGIIFAGALSIAEQLRLRFILHQKKKHVKKLEDEITQLKEEAIASLSGIPQTPVEEQAQAVADRVEEEKGEPEDGVEEEKEQKETEN